ncbi:hypothetical protein [Paenibacillus xylanexedens]|uniref:hypothetical protein n=1 Tax=Paenibacillus xylanexedens TaxID=528191 RepID=UPI00142F3937|nr:hypothetical protein [Paenibacillus xylanexedens]
MVWLCKIAEISRAGYYKWKKNIALKEKRAERDAVLKAHILGIYRIRPYFGTRTGLEKKGFCLALGCDGSEQQRNYSLETLRAK